uniref:Putative rna-binding protein musashi/mrna cleavage and polyadenylation factor i complex n=1 Tax=Corethrella appendiculata TaxID=1370023 RepID=U5ENC5_9DIPT
MHPQQKMTQQELEDHEKGKLFVGGLSWETTQENLQRYFSRYGEVIDCVVMKNNETGRSRGFGFVTFADPDNVDRALDNGPHTLDGRTIDPKPCNPRSMHKPKRTGGYPKVFLGGLPPNITETDLRGFFNRYGNVMEVVIMYDQEKKKSRGFGFLSFENDAAVDRATQDHFVNISGKQVEIKKAEPRDGSSNNNSMNPESYQWGSPQGAPMGNGQMGGPPINMQSNMMQGYQGWGGTQQPQGYGGYGAASAGANYQGWGAPPPQQWGNYNAQPQQQTGYGGYDMYSSSGGTAGGYGSGNWNTWNIPPNSAGSGSNDMYSRPQSGPQTGPTGAAGPTSNPSKPGSEYGAGGYGNAAGIGSAAYNYYQQNDQTSTYNNRPRSAYGGGNEQTTQPPYPAF